MIPAILLGLWALALGAYDLVHRRIPNLALLIVLVPAVLALCVNARGLLQASVLSSLTGMLIALAVYLPGYALGKMGAGDVKFAAALGLLLGIGRTADMLLLSALALGLFGLLWLKVFSASAKTRFPAGTAFALAFCVELIAGPLVPVFRDWP